MAAAENQPRLEVAPGSCCCWYAVARERKALIKHRHGTCRSADNHALGRVKGCSILGLCSGSAPCPSRACPRAVISRPVSRSCLLAEEQEHRRGSERRRARPSSRAHSQPLPVQALQGGGGRHAVALAHFPIPVVFQPETPPPFTTRSLRRLRLRRGNSLGSSLGSSSSSSSSSSAAAAAARCAALRRRQSGRAAAARGACAWPGRAAGRGAGRLAREIERGCRAFRSSRTGMR
jgi:hypothetical protein